MYSDEYDKTTIDNFKGLFNRGTVEEVPKDHGCDLSNVQFTRLGKVSTRGQCVVSRNVGTTVVRSFLATLNNSSLKLLTCDGAGNLYVDGTLLLSRAGMIDFAAINIFNKVIIAPIVSTYSATNYVMVYDGTTIRPLGGYAPLSSFTAADGAAGGVDAGEHKFAVIYETNTGFYTPPGPKIAGVFTPVAWTSPGSKQVNLSGIPIGPTGTIRRHILSTKVGRNEYFFIPGGDINDNVTTTLVLDFQDSQLTTSADYLFDVKEFVLGGAGLFGGIGLQEYDNRLIITGTENDLVRVSNANDCETFNDVTGYIQIPSQNDGNIVRCSGSLFDTLYFFKAVGAFAVSRSGSDPSAWQVVQIDGSIGCFASALSTITGSQTALSANSVMLLANRQGLFAFNGNVSRPHLAWKIQQTWGRITPSYENRIVLAQDAFTDTIYCLLPVDGSTTPNLLLVANFSEGLNSEAVKWSIYNFGFTPKHISMMSFDDGTGDYNYYLRLAGGNTLYKLKPEVMGDDYSGPINSYFTSYATSSNTPGAVELYRFIGVSVKGSGSLIQSMFTADSQSLGAAANIILSSAPSREYLSDINVFNERVLFKFEVDGGYFQLDRVDIYHKVQLLTRPK